MYNFQAKVNKAFKRARYLERGAEYRTMRKDKLPCRKECDCKCCKQTAYALAAARGNLSLI